MTPLEALENIKHYDTRVGLHEDDYNIIETALKRLEIIDRLNEKHCEDTQKKLKALEIIKEEPIVALVDYKYTYEEWLELVDEREKDLFRNQEEFDLLKEVLK